MEPSARPEPWLDNAPLRLESLARWFRPGGSAMCINLDRNTEKWSAVEASYAHCDLEHVFGFRLIRVPAVLGSELNLGTAGLLSAAGAAELQATEARGYRTHHYQLTRGAVGCFLSHRIVFEQLRLHAKEGDGGGRCCCLVLEDDTMIDADIGHRLAEMQVPDDWGIILLGTSRVRKDAHDVTHDLARVQGFWGTHGYLVSARGADALLRAFDLDAGMDAQIDAKISACAQLGVLNVYAADEQLVSHNPEFEGLTDIQWPIVESPDSYFYRGMHV